MEIWFEKGIYPIHDFYNFDQQIWQFFGNSQIFEIWHFTIFKLYKVPRLTTLHSNAFDQEFWPLWVLCCFRSKDFRTRGQNKYAYVFYSDFLYLNYTNLQRVKEKFPLFVFNNISPKNVVKLKKTCLLNKFINGGPLVSSHTV